MQFTAVILAAGRGRRMGADQNKVFLPVSGRPLLAHTLASLAATDRIDELVLVVHPDDEENASELMPSTGLSWSIVHGGAQRRDSALAGVRAARGSAVLIHDGARPFPSPELIERVIEGTLKHGACIPVLPVVDTLRRVDGDRLVDGTISRDGLARIQTPQGFLTGTIRDALERSDPSITDDAAAVLALGGEVWTVPGESTNLKITTRDDLGMAEAVAQSRSAGDSA